MTKVGERDVKNIERAYGGAGYISVESLISEEEMGKGIRVFAKVTVKQFCEIGHHEHHGETEAYYILSGAGLYEDNGKAIPVEAGDVVYCNDGDGHGIKNADEEDLVFIALVIKK